MDEFQAKNGPVLFGGHLAKDADPSLALPSNVTQPLPAERVPPASH